MNRAERDKARTDAFNLIMDKHPDNEMDVEFVRMLIVAGSFWAASVDNLPVDMELYAIGKVISEHERRGKMSAQVRAYHRKQREAANGIR